MSRDGEASGKAESARARFICAAIAAAYSLFMLYLLFVRNRPRTVDGPIVFGTDIKLIPFVTTLEFIEILTSHPGRQAFFHGIRNLAGNVVLFVPYGFFLPYLSVKCRRFGITLLCSAIGITAVELAQLITRRGICDIDDLIFNLAGVSLGFVIFRAWRKARQQADIS